MVDFNRTQTVARPRRQAMITVATVLIGWVAFYQVGIQWRARASTTLDHPPRFFVDLESASEAELQLLPDVGKKTARAWRATLDESPVPPPRASKELENLPNVGPVRSTRLAPFLVESDYLSIRRLEASNEASRPSANP